MTWALQGRSRIMGNDEELARLVFPPINYVDGKAVPREPERRRFRANVQPLNGRDLLLVPEHQRFLEQYWLYVPGEVFERGNRAEGTGELVERAGLRFQVQSVEAWGGYQRVKVMRVDVGYHANP